MNLIPPATGAPSLTAHRFFFALRPDPVTARRTHAFAESECGQTGLLEPERLHVTLALTPDRTDAPAPLIEALRRAGDTVRAAPFDLSLDRLSAGRHTIALRPGRTVAPLVDLQARIVSAMAEHDVALRPDWAFSPHETLCYRKGEPFSRPVTGFGWPVRDFVRIHSFVGLHRHDVVARWPLRSPEPVQGSLF
ncbi:putative 2'-5' RNA ligase [Sphingobium sp. SYK-6]|uniref:2'-5' RNA ligase family protein n=1 Tax=Sphingobium sp. (strain NBRC 103272 / SYK-6) TaxID=627192 RepID=UPI0002276DE7|nr:2'-5' RNA ligase family protein [Sphingobium sp. SYK-6]BAK65011.1 putative 2'-5' RNA ligase [Sphingobium sp. SYK-6]